jgi:glycine cleavage system aminomethyltransferase T
MAMVDRDAAGVGTTLEAVIRDARAPAVVVPLPFHRRERGAS